MQTALKRKIRDFFQGKTKRFFVKTASYTLTEALIYVETQFLSENYTANNETRKKLTSSQFQGENQGQYQNDLFQPKNSWKNY